VDQIVETLQQKMEVLLYFLQSHLLVVVEAVVFLLVEMVDQVVVQEVVIPIPLLTKVAQVIHLQLVRLKEIMVVNQLNFLHQQVIVKETVEAVVAQVKLGMIHQEHHLTQDQDKSLDQQLQMVVVMEYQLILQDHLSLMVVAVVV
tara:strand:+ start:62 stop:496 length:435 start_codon:yes stop_codon:yes gene_type:complete